MASASSTSARSLFIESKMRLADRVQVNVNNIASLARQIQRASRSSEILMHSVKSFTQQEHGLENSTNNLKKLSLITTHFEYQLDAIDRSCAKLEEVTEQTVAGLQQNEDIKIPDFPDFDSLKSQSQFLLQELQELFSNSIF